MAFSLNNSDSHKRDIAPDGGADEVLAADGDECWRRQNRKPPTVSENDVSAVPRLTNRRLSMSGCQKALETIRHLASVVATVK